MNSEILSQRELRRYGRHIMLNEIGIKGQEKLKKASVLVIGAGGLGCPVLQYLSAAGVGKISIIDFEMVDETNLARQVLYGSSDLGKLKSIIARTRLESLNPLNEYSIVNLRFTASNSYQIIKDFDLVVDATDSIEARYIISDATSVLEIPMVHGSIYKYQGIVSVFNYRGGPSYRDFNPENGKEYRNPSPSESGFFGVVPGITGTIMANEVIKIITGTGEILSGKLLLIDLFNNRFNIFSLSKYREDRKIREEETSPAIA